MITRKQFTTALAATAVAAGLFLGCRLPGFAAAWRPFHGNGAVPAPLSLEADGPTAEPGQLVQLSVGGISLERAKQAATTYYPREGVQFTPAATWDGKLLLLFSAKKPGSYLVGIYAPGADGVAKVEKEILVSGDPRRDNVAAGKIWLIVVERSRNRSAESDAVEQALHAYADAQQEGRWRLLDQQAKDENGNVPQGFARFLDAFAKTGGEPRLFIVAADTGAVLHADALPKTKDAALALAHQYGG